MSERLGRLVALFGRVELAFALLLLSYFALGYLVPSGAARLAALLGVLATGFWLGVRLARAAFRYITWRLRYRLLVTYLFIALVPITLILLLAFVGAYALTNQIAIYLVTSELDRQIATLAQTGSELASVAPENWSTVAPHLIEVQSRGETTVEVLVRSKGRSLRYPAASKIDAPPEGWRSTAGVVMRGGRPHLWSYQKSGSADLVVVQPLTREILAGLVPNLGIVDFGPAPQGQQERFVAVLDPGAAPPRNLPQPANRFDREVAWFATIPADTWEDPAAASAPLVIAVRSRVSAVMGSLFNRPADLAQGVLRLLLFFLAGVFLVVELISAIIGATMTRTITGAVHHLYEGTQRVTAGDFAHRIPVTGHDQLSDLGHSFNRMTENIERLLSVAKEKERMDSEVQIAREVQKHLFPREAPRLQSLRLAAICNAARAVSGDYYDYALLSQTQAAVAIGDVAGKGISAALLMASLQSALRSEWQAGGAQSTATIVSRLNRQLYANTAPEKYATFCLGLYDDALGVLTYTNAGHLPPLLIRRGEAQPLDVNGTVVGAFPAAKYEESYLVLESGDLLLFFTDGATEPENSFGEMFGEERLAELVLRNTDLTEEEILEEIATAIRQWTGGGELQDDLTLLLLRRM